MKIDYASRPYQTEVKTKLNEFVEAGGRRALIVMPTGTGKTFTALDTCLPAGRTLFGVHREELVKQTEKSARALVSGIDIGIVKADLDQIDARDLVIACIPTLSKQNRLDRLLKAAEGRPFRRVIADEAHHAIAPSWIRVLDAFREVPTIGFTATPERSDRKNLSSVWGPTPLYQLSLEKAIDDGWLVPYNSERIVCDNLHLENVRINPDTGDYDLTELEKEIVRADVAKAVAEKIAWAVKDLGRKVLGFVTSVNQAERVSDHLRAMGVTSDWLCGEHDSETREAVLGKHRRGEIKALINFALFTEGYDDPSIDCIVMARPCASRGLYIQCVGRGLRLWPSKSDLLIIDLVGAHVAHGVITADNMLQEDKPRKKGERRGPAVTLPGTRDVEFGQVLATAEAAKHGIAAKSKQKRARTKWLCVLPERVYALAAGDHGTLLMVREFGDADDWMGYRLPKDAWTFTEARRIMARAAPREFTVGIVEDRARKLGVFGLSNENAKWRDKEPSDGQKDRLRGLGINVIPETRGAAADLITETSLRALFKFDSRFN